MLDFPSTPAAEKTSPHSEWDLTSPPPWGDDDASDQLAELADAVGEMVGGVHRAVLTFASGGARTAAGTAAVSARVHHIRTELEAVARAVEALHSGAEDASRAGEASAQMCSELAAEVERGSVVLGRVVESMEAMGAQRERIERLADQLDEIANFSRVIKQVADKTKLLALNATIEAARAGAHGAAFRVVADEIGSLAADSEVHTRHIAAVVTATHADLQPLREAIDAARDQGDGVDDAHAARETVRRIGELAEQLTAPAQQVAASSEEQLQALGEMAGHMQGTVVAVTEVDEHATEMSAQALSLSDSSEQVYELLRPFRTGSFVDNTGDLARGMAREVSHVLEGIVDRGEATLDQVLDPRYEEIKGAAIASLGRLFDVSRVPAEGFDPPKYSVGYDHLVDQELRRIFDRHQAEHPWLAIATASDLNAYNPSHLSADSADWTGDPEVDARNRAKILMVHNPAIARANRYGIGGGDLPLRPMSRSEYRAAGCDLAEPAGGERRRLLQTYVRPGGGGILTVLAAPLYVHGERWGAVVMGWNPDAVGR